MRDGWPVRAVILTSIFSTGYASVASAQDISGAVAADANMFARDRNTSVRERPRSGYEAPGIPAGAFTISPRLTASVTASDNVFATDTNERSDTIWRVVPEVSIFSGWSRHSLRAFATSTLNRYNEFDAESSDEYTLGASGALDVVRNGRIDAAVDFTHSTEPRSSPNSPTASVEPIQLNQTVASLGGQRTFSRTRFKLNADYRKLDYKDGINAAGGVVNQQGRDREIVSGSIRVDYAVTPSVAVFGQIVGNERNYVVPSSATFNARDSRGYQAVIGTEFDLGNVARGEIAAGYLSQQYDSQIYKDIDGFSAEGLIEYFPTALTTVTFTGNRTVEESVLLGSAGYLSSNLSVRVDHELRRNILLFARGSYGVDDYQSVDRDDDNIGAGVGLAYLVNRAIGVSVDYSYLERQSDGANAGRSFASNKLAISLVAQF